ncbi:MAG: hypothetical protein IT200_16775 [Thermoleophilia bacterium]|nr:hypothetical protein [Thermoleophilia bacterium]
MTELGRMRLGEKGQRGEPTQRTTWRLTSASQRLLEQVAEVYGGTVRPWAGAPDEGYFELATTAHEVDILIPPTLASYSQAMELWSGGGCVRRCDGITEKISGRPCMCDPERRECQVTTRVSVMLPKVPGLGVWRLDTKGWNAAATLPTTLETLGAIAPGQWIPAVLRIQKQSSKKIVNGRSQTRRFVVPVIDIVSGTIGEALDGALSAGPAPRLDAGPSRREKVARPALGPAAPLPERAQLRAGDRPERVTRPTTSAPASGGTGATQGVPAAQPDDAAPAAESAAPIDSGAADDADVIDGQAVEVQIAVDTKPAQCDGFHEEMGRCRQFTGHDGPHKSKDGVWPR